MGERSDPASAQDARERRPKGEDSRIYAIDFHRNRVGTIDRYVCLAMENLCSFLGSIEMMDDVPNAIAPLG